MKKSFDSIRAFETLQAAGINKTPQRLAVLHILQQANRPLNVGDIRKQLSPRTRINKVTVYRILAVLKKMGIVRDVLSSAGAIYFEMATAEHPVHPHFNCTNCGVMNCLTPLTFSQARHFMNAPDNCSIDHIDIHISGLCNGCLQATKLQSPEPKRGRS